MTSSLNEIIEPYEDREENSAEGENHLNKKDHDWVDDLFDDPQKYFIRSQEEAFQLAWKVLAIMFGLIFLGLIFFSD